MKPSTTAMVALLAVGLASTACGANDEGATRRLGSGAVTSVPVTVAAAPGTTAPPVTNAGPAATSTVPAVAAPPLSSSSRLRIDGLGPVEVGMTVAQVRSAAGVELSLDHLPLCDVLTAPRGPTGVSLMVTTPASGRVALIIVNGGSTATISGIRVGSTEAEVLAAYPGRLRLVNPLLPVHRLIFEAADAALADRALVFVIDNSRVATDARGLRNQAEAGEICA